MGNELEAVPNKLRLAYNPTLQNWAVLQKSEKVKLWQNKKTGQLAQEYEYVATNKAQLYKLRTHFEHRFNKPYIVASKFFKQRQTDQLCSSFYETSMFIEYIGLKLSQFRDVTFPDCLHLYNACLHGFGQLQARLGYFDVSDSLVGLNQYGQVKVWANADFSKERPQLVASKEGEFQMLKEVIQLVNRNSDIQTEPQSISSYLLQNTRSFQQAVAALRQYAAKHEVQIPKCLQTVNHLRKRGVLDAGPFIKAQIETIIINPPPQNPPPHLPSNLSPNLPPHPAPTQDSKHPISLLQAQAMKYPYLNQKSPAALITQKPHITAVMYQPIEAGGWNITAQPYPRQNIIVNTNNLKNSEELSSIYHQNIENRFNNIKQSEIISEMLAPPGVSPEEEAMMVHNFKPKTTQQRPIYLSTPAFVQREGGTAGNIANLNKKYFNIAPPFPPSFSPDLKHPPLVPRSAQAHQASLSNVAKNINKRNPPIFSSLQGSHRQINNFKGSQNHGQGEFFNNTIIHSIQNQVRRDEMEAASRLDARRNKLRVYTSLRLTISNGDIVDIQKQPSEANLKQSAIHVFSISLNNKQQQDIHVNHPVRVFSQEDRDQYPIPIEQQQQKIYQVHYDKQSQQPIRYTESQACYQEFPTPQMQTEQVQPQRYSYIPNYSFDKNYEIPIPVIKNQAQFIENEVQLNPVEIYPYRDNQLTQVYKEEEIITSQPINSSNIILKATIRNQYKVEGGLRPANSASEIISSIEEIRNSERQLREELRQFI